MSKEIDVSPEEYRISYKLGFISSQYVEIICVLNELFKNGIVKDSDIRFALKQFGMLSDQVANLMNYAKTIQGSDL